MGTGIPLFTADPANREGDDKGLIHENITLEGVTSEPENNYRQI